MKRKVKGRDIYIENTFNWLVEKRTIKGWAEEKTSNMLIEMH